MAWLIKASQWLLAFLQFYYYGPGSPEGISFLFLGFFFVWLTCFDESFPQCPYYVFGNPLTQLCRFTSYFHVMFLVLSSNPLRQAAICFVSDNTVFSKFNIVACGLSLIILLNDEKTHLEAVFAVVAFFLFSLCLSDGLRRFRSSTFSICLAIVKQKFP